MPRIHHSVKVIVERPEGGEYPRLRVDKNPLYIRPGQTIDWTVWEGKGEDMRQVDCPLTVHFSPASPLTYRRVMSASGRPVEGRVRESIFPGKYSYFVAIHDPVTQKVITEDPEIIDENGDDPGGGEH